MFRTADAPFLHYVRLMEGARLDPLAPRKIPPITNSSELVSDLDAGPMYATMTLPNHGTMERGRRACTLNGWRSRGLNLSQIGRRSNCPRGSRRLSGPMAAAKATSPKHCDGF
ncbi:protein of unknown function [Kyrpidia spormannii]|uniref:Uncharacterized protein n=1 Tax=Kyrpidia spormannii TaxID=2055160 RepID=A0ACA8ZAU2_9BACL|nr:protein of unknown function [Kyrpidia spormannii]